MSVEAERGRLGQVELHGFKPHDFVNFSLGGSHVRFPSDGCCWSFRFDVSCFESWVESFTW